MVEGQDVKPEPADAVVEGQEAKPEPADAVVEGQDGPSEKPGENPDALVQNPPVEPQPAGQPEEKPADQPEEKPAENPAEENPQLAAARAEIEVLIAQVDEQQAAEGAEKAVDVEAVKAQVEAVVNAAPGEKDDEQKLGELQAIQQQLLEQVPQDAMTDVVEDMQNKLQEAEASIAQLNADLQEKQEAIDGLNGQIEALSGQAEADAAELEKLQGELAKAQAEAKAQGEELTEKVESYEKQVAALEAYKVTREPAAGEAHTATTVGSVIEIEADGVTGAWDYSNSDISGNPISLSLLLDEAEIFAAKLQPGESLDGIALNAPLAAGTYQAMAVTVVTDADGENQLTTRVPVTLHVAG